MIKSLPLPQRVREGTSHRAVGDALISARASGSGLCKSEPTGEVREAAAKAFKAVGG